MKFITEDELRDIYKIHPFTTYEAEPGSRLTPGARQFLADRGIRTFDDDPAAFKRSFVTIDEDEKKAPEEAAISPIQPAEINIPVMENEIQPSVSATAHADNGRKTWRERKLEAEFKLVDAAFLLAENKLLKRNILTAQKLSGLEKQYKLVMKAAVGGGVMPADLEFTGCSGMDSSNYSCALLDCFDINEFHMQLENGREILLLHRLRCELEKLEAVIMEASEAVGDCERYETVAGKINQITNSLSQIICTAVGGKECQRTS